MRNWTMKDGNKLDLSAGIFLEILDKMEKRNAMWKECFLEEELKALLNDMAEEAEIDLLYHAYLFKADCNEGKVQKLYFACRNGVTEIEAEYFIDATGDAQITFLAGYPTTPGREAVFVSQ